MPKARRLAAAVVALVPFLAACPGQDEAEPPPPAVRAEVDISGQPAPLTHGNDPLPARPPGLVAQLAPETAWPCEGTGVDGRRVQLIYAHDGSGSIAARRPTFEVFARQIEGIFAASAQATGGERLLRFVTGPDCGLSILDVAVSPDALASFDAMISELRSRGLADNTRIYHAFVESNAYCGIGTIYDDDRPTGNANEAWAQYGRSDRPCWTAQVAAHEIVHNLGGVQNSAPNSTLGLHCRDEHDVMCYPDGAPQGQMIVACADAVGEDRLDCNADDYFSAAPSPAGYLAGHWNVASSAALTRSAGPPPTTTPPPPTTSTTTLAPPPTTSTTVGPGKTSTDLVAPSSVTAGEPFTVQAAVSGSCGPSGAVAFYASGRLMSRQILDASGSAALTLIFDGAVGRPTIRADYVGNAVCAASRDTARVRVG